MKLYTVIIFVGLALVGIIGINTIPPLSKATLETTTTDGVTISYTLYQPAELTENLPVVIIGHGIMVNKEIMSSFAVELATQGYIVASLDWRGHGQSTGELSREGLYKDLEAVIADIPAHAPADMETIALLGYSMGGFPTYAYAADHSAVKAWVGVGAAADGEISDTTNPKNVLMVIAKYDEAFSPEEAKIPMAALTGVSLEDVEFERLYGSMQEGTARKIHVVPGADHLTTAWNSEFIKSAALWIGETVTGSPPQILRMVFHTRVALLAAGLTGFVGVLFVFSSALAGKWGITKNGTADSSRVPGVDMPVFSFIGKYYLVTFLLFFTMAVFLPLFVTPLPFSAFLTTLTGGLGINMLVYSWLLARPRYSIKAILKKNFSWNPRGWMFSVAVTVVFMLCYYFLIGRHFLGMIPSVTRIFYLVLYTAILFCIFSSYSFFVQKVLTPFLEKALDTKTPVTAYVAVSAAAFILIYSWFAVVVLVPCIALGNFFFAMILILMIPIFLFMSFFSVYMERITGSIIPSSVLHSVWLGFVITTLSPYAGIMG